MTAHHALNVLLVDDSPSMTRILSKLMTQIGFHNVDHTHDGQTALTMVEAKAYDLVLCDWKMAPTSGLDVLRAMRAQARTRSTPFIMVSSERRTDHIALARDTGASNYLVKPFDVDALRQKLCAVLGGL